MPKMPLRCAYKAYAVISKQDGTIYVNPDGGAAVFLKAGYARSSISSNPLDAEYMRVARCYIVPAEIWEQER